MKAALIHVTTGLRFHVTTGLRSLTTALFSPHAGTCWRLAARHVPWERCGRWLLLVSLVACFPVALSRAVRDGGGTDFPEYYAAGRHVLDHGTVNSDSLLKYYLPSVDVAWAGLALLPMPVACGLYYVLSCVTWLGLLRSVEKYLLGSVEQPLARYALLAAALMMLPLALDHLCLGVFHLLMLWLMISGLGRVSHGRPWSGSVLLGIAVWIKLLPILGVGYLVLKRTWREPLLAVATAAAIGAVVSLAALGPQETRRSHGQWWRITTAGTAGKLLSSPVPHEQQRNSIQSLPAVLRRSLTTLGLAGHGEKRIVLADLSPPQLRLVYMTILGTLGLAVAWVCRKPANRLTPGDWPAEISLVALSMLWVSPVVPSYHALAALPAAAVILSRHWLRPIGWGLVIGWFAALGLHGAAAARSLGHMLWISMLLAGLLVWVTRRDSATAHAP